MAVRADSGERSNDVGPLEMTAGLDASSCLASFARVRLPANRTLGMTVCPGPQRIQSVGQERVPRQNAP